MADKKVTAPYGTWRSPITSELVSGGNVTFKEVHANQVTGQIYLLEGRPAESGRAVITEFKEGKSIDVFPEGFSAKTKVHEYGGGASAMSPDGSIIFNDGKTNGVYSVSPSGEVVQVLKGDDKTRFADFAVHPKEPHWVLAVKEDHALGTLEDVTNMIVAIDTRRGAADTIASGADFYSHPRFSPDGSKVSWMQWNHPDMPWTGSEVFVADWKERERTVGQYVAGKPKMQSICQPKWHFDGTLLFEDDKTGFWQLYQFDPKTSKVEHILLQDFEDADIGIRENELGNCTYISLNNDEVVITYTKNATDGILLYNFARKIVQELEFGLVKVQQLSRVSDTHFSVIAGSATAPAGLYLVDVTQPTEKTLLKSTAQIEIDPKLFSEAQAITFPRTHGTDQSGSAHAMFIPPRNPGYLAPEGTKPPLIVNIHGGPTSHVGPGLSLGAQYYTSRGYAYCYVNHAGSTGYGRKYREDIDYSWGLKDCEDTVSCIEYLASQNLIDASKVGITGGSAGGYTTLQAMVSYPTVFAAGCSLYGVGNLKSLAQETHKFESYYLFALLFPEDTSEDEKEKVYTDRSPCLHVDRIERPLLMLQGDEDKVVPMGQAIEMERVMSERGKDVKLVIFKGEGHGFVMQEHVKTAIEEEEALWNRTLL